MANCVTCKARCENAGQHRVQTDCVSYISKDYPKPITNADRIRAMTDEELAKEIAWLIVEAMKQLHPLASWKASDDVLISGTAGEMLEWLKQEAT